MRLNGGGNTAAAGETVAALPLKIHLTLFTHSHFIFAASLFADVFTFLPLNAHTDSRLTCRSAALALYDWLLLYC